MIHDNSQNIIILLLVAVITGFVLPALTKAFEIVFTREVEKKTEIRNKQLELIEQLTKIVWEWRFLGKQVCYYGYSYKIEDDRFRLAITNYNDRVWTIFTDIKAIKSKSIVWFPEIVPEEIEKLYDYIKGEVDSNLSILMDESTDKESNLSNEFNSLGHDFSKKVSPRIEKHLKKIADTISKANT